MSDSVFMVIEYNTDEFLVKFNRDDPEWWLERSAWQFAETELDISGYAFATRKEAQLVADQIDKRCEMEDMSGNENDERFWRYPTGVLELKVERVIRYKVKDPEQQNRIFSR